jgi:hypothetical protein
VGLYNLLEPAPLKPLLLKAFGDMLGNAGRTRVSGE